MFFSNKLSQIAFRGQYSSVTLWGDLWLAHLIECIKINSFSRQKHFMNHSALTKFWGEADAPHLFSVTEIDQRAARVSSWQSRLCLLAKRLIETRAVSHLWPLPALLWVFGCCFEQDFTGSAARTALSPFYNVNYLLNFPLLHSFRLLAQIINVRLYVISWSWKLHVCEAQSL